MSFLGIDVAKPQLELACRPSGEAGRVTNDEEGSAIGRLYLTVIRSLSCCLTRCEAAAAALTS